MLSQSAILDSFDDQLFGELSHRVQEQQVKSPPKLSNGGIGSSVSRRLSTETSRLDEDDDDELLEMLKPPSDAVGLSLKPVPYRSPSASSRNSLSPRRSSSHTSGQSISNAKYPAAPYFPESSETSSDEDDEGWRRNVMNADDLQDLMTGIQGASLASVFSMDKSGSPPFGTSRSHPHSNVESTYQLASEASSVSKGNSVASKLAGLQRLPSRSSSCSSSDAPRVLRSRDLADLMADLDMKGSGPGTHMMLSDASMQPLEASAGSGCFESGEGILGSVVATWKADSAPGHTEKHQHGSLSDGTLAYSSDREVVEPTPLGSPQPAFRPLPVSAGIIRHPASALLEMWPDII